VCVCARVCACVCVNMWQYVRVCARVGACMGMCIQICMSANMCVYVCVCVEKARACIAGQERHANIEIQSHIIRIAASTEILKSQLAQKCARSNHYRNYF